MAAMCVFSFNLSDMHFSNDFPKFSIIHYIKLGNSRTDHARTYIRTYLLFSSLYCFKLFCCLQTNKSQSLL